MRCFLLIKYLNIRQMLLVTTALEETWGSDEEILFLGEWCKLYDRKEIWSKRVSSTLADPWSDRHRRFSAYQFTEEVYKKTIECLAGVLNDLHKLNYPVRYWKILCGPWLRLFITTTYHQWECISDVIKSAQCTETIEIATDFESQIPIDMMDFENKIVADYWNHYISTLIVSSFAEKINSRIVGTINTHNNSISCFRQASNNRKLISNLLRFAGTIINSSKSVFVSNSYLSKVNNIKLCMRLRVVPSITIAEKNNQKYKYNKKFRVNLTHSDNQLSDYEIFLNKVVLLLIPFSYVEGFCDLQRIVDNNKWQQNPHSIVTAVDHYSNDVFKCYSANKVVLGSKLNIICHGGGGKYKYSDFQSLELDLCDHYFTWGWSEYSLKCVQGHFIKGKGVRRNAKKNNKYLLHITLAQYRYQKFIDSTPSYEQYVDGYINDQIEFLNKIESNIQNDTITKLSYDYQNSIESRINEKCTNVHYARMGEDYYKLLENAKLVVTTYNCTTPVESIAMNIPTIIFWNPEHWELAPSAIPFFNNLLACGVFHESPESAALKVNQIWGDVDGWWQSQKVKSACDEFRMWFSRKSQEPIRELVNFCNM